MARSGRRAPRVATPRPEGSTRMCIGCRGLFPRESLVRLVRGPAGELGVDRHLRAPGRGAHLCYSRPCIEAAVKRKAIGRALPGGPSAGPGPDVGWLVSEIVTAIEARIHDALSLGRMSGRTASGGDALEAAWSGGQIKLLVLACDAAENTAHRWTARELAAGLPIVRFGTASTLGRVQGAEARVAIGVVEESLAERVRAEFDRRDLVLVAA